MDSIWIYRIFIGLCNNSTVVPKLRSSFHYLNSFTFRLPFNNFNVDFAVFLELDLEFSSLLDFYQCLPFLNFVVPK